MFFISWNSLFYIRSSVLDVAAHASREFAAPDAADENHAYEDERDGGKVVTWRGVVRLRDKLYYGVCRLGLEKEYPSDMYSIAHNTWNART